MIESYAFLALALTYEDPTSDPFPELNYVNWKKLSSQTYRYFLALGVAFSVLTVAQTAQALVMSGDSGTQVRQIQQRLQELGYFNANVTGYFGSLTQDAVIRFQRNAGLSADGIVGPQTLRALGLVSSEPSNPGSNRDLIGLGRGDSGPGVSDLQRRLQTLGYFNQQPTGNFGTVTENAVIQLQQDYNLPATGLVTEATLAVLNSGLNSGQNVVFPGTTLQQGDRGSAVATLQQTLQNLGFYDGNITGYFDDQTEVAVQRFQQSQGLSATGVVTSTTLVALNLYVPGVPSNPQFDNILRLGSQGSAVRILQGQLQRLGYYTGIVDGVFGRSTQQAVINFQRAYGITVTGEVGPTTTFYLASARTANTSTPMFTPPSQIPIVQHPMAPVTSPLSTVYFGDSGAEVRKIQRRLRELNYYNGPINGFFDTATQEALICFQRSSGITATGIAGPTTQTYLFNIQPLSATPTRTVLVAQMAPPISGSTNIQQLQQTLRIQGLYNGPINGIYDSSTQQAVAQARAFYGPSADTILFGGQ
ncbi:N-acetylmuramoyl-L-alanine amidase CwlM [Planktothrix tepida]|uniref:Peptidoglycan-binding domain 1 protein n=1 Tax=Planktothrix tepida PCC 9214 TaxID=671072 RepID=A0A1J1LKB5_9CYAN|nr:peptidoglycan-binding protein [Planktothrix tepida]CAD5949160.1 N-acetylmuramoyl-L-alanine amidase CwlM [Planktothrix tepida]CUR32482.1 Peptidoglycan-binding domain 1 protein [Planktothrix tepida PCC 9214]